MALTVNAYNCQATVTCSGSDSNLQCNVSDTWQIYNSSGTFSFDNPASLNGTYVEVDLKLNIEPDSEECLYTPKSMESSGFSYLTLHTYVTQAYGLPTGDWKLNSIITSMLCPSAGLQAGVVINHGICNFYHY